LQQELASDDISSRRSRSGFSGSAKAATTAVKERSVACCDAECSLGAALFNRQITMRAEGARRDNLLTA
jgi:hypothetical protein